MSLVIDETNGIRSTGAMKKDLSQTADTCALLVAAALPVELRPLIDCFSATRLEGTGPWPVYSNPDKRVMLVETGVGMLAAAAAVSHTLARFNLPNTCTVLNVGIAGSGAYERGQWVLAQEVVDTTTSSHYYLRPPRIAGLERGCVRSYGQPSDDYGLSALLDMEAAGVVSAAKRFVALEQVWVAKLVSDKSLAQQHALDKQAVRQLLQDQFAGLMPVLGEALQYSDRQRAATDLPPVPPQWLERLHFSVSHKRRLARLWRSYRVYFPDYQQLDLNRFGSAREVIQFLETQLKTVSSHWEAV